MFDLEKAEADLVHHCLAMEGSERAAKCGVTATLVVMLVMLVVPHAATMYGVQVLVMGTLLYTLQSYWLCYFHKRSAGAALLSILEERDEL